MKVKLHDQGEGITKKDYSKKIIFPLADFIEKGHLLQIVTIPPRTKQREHYHHKQTEVWYILEGETSIFLNGKEYVSHSGDAFIASPGEKHYMWNKTDKDFKVLVFKINMPETDEDTVWLD